VQPGGESNLWRRPCSIAGHKGIIRAGQIQLSLELPSIPSRPSGRRFAKPRLRFYPSTCRNQKLVRLVTGARPRFGVVRARGRWPIWRTAPFDSLGTGLTMISAYEHGRNAARHAKHIQACPFDTGTAEWREWRAGFCALSQTLPNSSHKLAMAPQRRPRSLRGARACQSPLSSMLMRSRHAS
jgi:hypothetical protein